MQAVVSPHPDVWQHDPDVLCLLLVQQYLHEHGYTAGAGLLSFADVRMSWQPAQVLFSLHTALQHSRGWRPTHASCMMTASWSAARNYLRRAV
jgi:hypothetical protein